MNAFQMLAIEVEKFNAHNREEGNYQNRYNQAPYLTP